MRRAVFFIATLMVLGAGGALADETGGAPPVHATIEVTVLGWVQHAGHYTLAAGSRLSAALAAAGGKRPPRPAIIPIDDTTTFAERAGLQRVFLTRTVDGQPTTYQIGTARAPDDPRYDVRYDPVLRSGDTISVPELRDTRFKIISVYGT